MRMAEMGRTWLTLAGAAVPLLCSPHLDRLGRMGSELGEQLSAGTSWTLLRDHVWRNTPILPNRTKS